MIRRLAPLLILLWSAHAFAAVTVNTASTPVNEASSSAFTISVSTSAGSNIGMFLLYQAPNGASGGSAITSATWNGTAMTYLTATSFTNSVTSRQEIWWMPNAPASTTANMVVNLNGSNNAIASAQGISFNGVDPFTPLGASGTNEITVSGNSVVSMHTLFSGSMLLDGFQARWATTLGALAFTGSMTQLSNTNPAGNGRVASAFQANASSSFFNVTSTTSGGSGLDLAVQFVNEIVPVQPTATPTWTPTNTPTWTPTTTPTPTSTKTVTSTNTPTSTPTFTSTATPTSTPTNTCTSTPTSSPTATPTSTPTSTPACIVQGELTPGPTPVGLWNVCLLKPVTIAAPSRLYSISVYIPSPGTGQIIAALYDNNHYQPIVIATGPAITGAQGWNFVPLSMSRIIPAGNYLIAIEASDTLTIASKKPGTDLFFGTTWGRFKSPAVPYPLYRDYTVNANFCNY